MRRSVVLALGGVLTMEICASCVVPNERFTEPTTSSANSGEVDATDTHDSVRPPSADLPAGCPQGPDLGNPTRSDAHDLGTLSPFSNLRAITGVLLPPDREAWHRYIGTSGAATGQPRLGIDGGLRACAFIRCSDGSPAQFAACLERVSDEELQGCCIPREFSSFATPYECSTAGDVEVFLRVDQGTDCQSYTLEYSF